MDYYKTLPVSPTPRLYNGKSPKNNINPKKESFSTKVPLGDIVLIKKNGLWGIYNTSGKELFPHIIDYITCEFSDGLIVGRIYKEKDNKSSLKKNRYVYFNRYGHKVLDSSDHIKMGEFSNGIALVEDEERLSAFYINSKVKHYRYFIDKDGNQVTKLIEVDNVDQLQFTPIFRVKDYKSYKEYVEHSKKEVKQLSLKL